MTLPQPQPVKPKLILEALAGKVLPRPPVWLMRQAGRYLPEYREIRATSESFIHFCFTPALASRATLQPIERFGFDAAILFSDILVIPEAFGQNVSFEQGEGPRLQPIEDAAGLARLHDQIDMKLLEPVFETIERVKGALPSSVALIGFCGAPWTVASYMIAGKGTPDQAPARLFAYRHPELLEKLIAKLVTASIDYLVRQIVAGVEVVQIFDSWAGVLPGPAFRKWSLEPILQIARGVKAKCPEARIIAFPRGVSTHLTEFLDCNEIDALGLNTSDNTRWVAQRVQSRKTVQGNLDPLVLLAGGNSLETEVRRIISEFSGGPHIFNLGHGILPATPIEHVEKMLRVIRS